MRKLIVRKEIRLKDLMYSGFDLNYYLKDPKTDTYIQTYVYESEIGIQSLVFRHIHEEGWYDLDLDKFKSEKYKYYFVDSLTLYEGGGFRLRISMPPRRIEKIRVFFLKLFRK